MKLRVIRRYVDKHTKETVYPDTVLDDASNERAQELIDAGVVEKVKAKPNKEDNTAPTA